MENINKGSILDQIKYWDRREEELKVAFKNPDLGKEKFFLKDKLKYYEGVRDASRNIIGEDKLNRNTLSGTIRKLEKQLYPNWWHRQFEKLVRNIEKAIEKYIDQSRIVPQSNILKSESILNQRSQDNNLKNSDEGVKQNLKNNAAQEIKHKEQQGQNLNAEPLKDSLPGRHTITTRPLRNTSSQDINKDFPKPKDEILPKKQLRHRLH